MNFTRSETGAIAYYLEYCPAGWALADLVCAKIPYFPAQTACDAVVILKAANLGWAVRNAQATNSCLQLAIPYSVLSNP